MASNGLNSNCHPRWMRQTEKARRRTASVTRRRSRRSARTHPTFQPNPAQRRRDARDEPCIAAGCPRIVASSRERAGSEDGSRRWAPAVSSRSRCAGTAAEPSWTAAVHPKTGGSSTTTRTRGTGRGRSWKRTVDPEYAARPDRVRDGRVRPVLGCHHPRSGSEHAAHLVLRPGWVDGGHHGSTHRTLSRPSRPSPPTTPLTPAPSGSTRRAPRSCRPRPGSDS